MKPKILNPALKKLIHILNDGQYHSGPELGKALHISRNAVWKYIRQLKDYQLPILHNTQGYCFEEPLHLIDPTKITKNIKEETFLKDCTFHIFSEIDSTNAYLKRLPSSPTLEICLSESQSAGRGRFNRHWHSPFGRNIYFSCRWPLKKELSELGGLSLIIGLAIIKALEAQGLYGLMIKWPNDIVWQHSKLAGILIEISAESHGSSQIIIGIGINVNMTQAPATIAQEWTSLQKILGLQQDRNLLVAALINQLASLLKKFEAQGFETLLPEWQQYDALLGKKINLKHHDLEFSGIAQGVNKEGQLCLQSAEGPRFFSAGEASLFK